MAQVDDDVSNAAPTHDCGMWILQDDRRSMCVLPHGHDGKCMSRAMLDWRPKLGIERAYENRTVSVENESMRRVSRGDGIYWSVPKWIADRLEEVGL